MPLSLPPPPGTQPISITEDSTGKPCKVRTDNFWTDWFNRLQLLLNTLIPAGGAQAAIQFSDEGGNLGTSGTANSINFIGPNLTVTRVGDTITVTEDAQAPLQFQDEGVNLGTDGTVVTLDFTGTGITVTRAANTVTVNVPSSSVDVGDIFAFAAAH